MCQPHYWSELKKKTTRQAPSGDDGELKDWYEWAISISDWVCENCGEPISAVDEKARYAAQAHILPKHLFRSVQTHQSNRLHLGNYYGCNCHDRYDFSFENAIKMPVFPLALERFVLFAPLISKYELRYLPKPFLERYNQL